MAVTQKIMPDNKNSSAWSAFPEHISVIRDEDDDLELGEATRHGHLQAEYTLNNVKRLKVLPSILEDAE